MLWPIDQELRTDVGRFSMQPHEILYEFEQPRIFTVHADGLLQLWYECAEGSNGERRYLVVPTDAGSVSLLKSGARTVHDALAQPWLWAVDVNAEGVATHAYVVHGLGVVPDTAKPKPNVPLLPHLEPLLSYRVIGEGLAEGRVPASVIEAAAHRPAAALKKLLEFASKSAAGTVGRPVDAFRRLYDLPAQRMAFNSFEIAFAAPDQQGLSDNYDGAAAQLAKALEWLTSEARDAQILPTELLEVLKDLAPPAHGQITAAEVGGQLMPHGVRVAIDRSDGTRVTRAIASRNQGGRVKHLTGRVGEFDTDNLSLMLREVTGDLDAEELRCTFPDELYDDLFSALQPPQDRITVVGRLKASGKVLAILAIDPSTEEMQPPTKAT